MIETGVQEIAGRASGIAICPGGDIIFFNDGNVRWMGQVIARIVANKKGALAPGIMLLAEKCLTKLSGIKVINHPERWLSNHIESLFRPLVELSHDKMINPVAGRIARESTKNFDHIERHAIVDQVKRLDRIARVDLR